MFLISLIVITSVLSTAVHVIDRSWNRGSDVYAMTFWSSVIQVLIVLPFAGMVSILPLDITCILLLVGAITALARISWYRALASTGDALSRLLPLTHASGFIVLLLAFAVLGESLPPWGVAGGCAMIFGAILISLEQPASTMREFLALNLALGLVLFQSVARSVNNVSYKWVFNQGDFSFFTIYFYLKLLELLSVAFLIMTTNGPQSKYRDLRNRPAFLVARGMQTISGLLFIYVLRHLDISVAEPVSAAGPLYAIAWEWMDMRFGLIVAMGGQALPGRDLSHLALILRFSGTVLIIGGFILLSQGKV